MFPRRLHVIWISRDVRLFLSLGSILSAFIDDCWNKKNEDKLELCLHVTSKTTEQQIIKILGNRYPILLPRTYIGRPVWKNLFTKWREIYSGQV